jgi:hypothetical protein
MVPFWIEEGQRQVQFGLLRQRYLHLLECQAASPPLDGFVRDLRQRRAFQPRKEGRCAAAGCARFVGGGLRATPGRRTDLR